MDEFVTITDNSLIKAIIEYVARYQDDYNIVSVNKELFEWQVILKRKKRRENDEL